MAKITAKMLSKYVGKTLPSCELIAHYEFDDQEFDLKVKSDMSIDNKRAFVDRVANACFDEMGEYHPEMRDVVFQITVLQMLTDVPVYKTKVAETDENGDEIEDKKIEVVDIDKSYLLSKALNLRSKLAHTSFPTLCEELSRLVAEKIIFKQQQSLMGERKYLDRIRSEMESGVALVNSVGEKLMESMDGMMRKESVLRAADEVSDRMKNMSTAELFEAIVSK